MRGRTSVTRNQHDSLTLSANTGQTRVAVARRLTAAVVTLLFVWLPALVGGAGIDGAPRDGELIRLQVALSQDNAVGVRSRPAEMYYAVALPSDSAGIEPESLLARARLANVAALFAVGGLLYLLLAVARRRSTGLLACLALAALPPVWQAGAVLRPEVPAAVFGSLALLLLAGFAQQVRHRPGESPVLYWLVLLVAMAAIGSLIGLAAACVPSAALILLVPGGAMLLVVGTLGLATPRLLRRMPWQRVPVTAMQRRMLPWVALCVVILLATLLTLDRCVTGEPIATATAVGLLPATPLGWLPLAVLAGLGGIRLLLGVGLRLDRLRRISPDTLIVIYAGVLLGQRAFGDRSVDALLAAPALAILVAEGARTVLVFAVWRFARYPHTNIA